MKMIIDKLLICLCLFFFFNACSPKITIPKQNMNLIKGESENTSDDDIAPAQEKVMECLILPKDCVYVAGEVMSSSKHVSRLLKYEKELGNINSSDVIYKMTKNVESIFYIDSRTGFASFSHPPASEYLMGKNLPFDKEKNAGGTDIFYFAPNDNNEIRFRSFTKINSMFWDSHPTAVTQTNSKGKCVTLIIFSSDRNNPFNSAITLNGDTIYGGSTDLYYSFGTFDSLSYDFANFIWTEARPLPIINTEEYNEGSPFVYCQCCNPTLFFSSNRANKSRNDNDMYSVKLKIDFDNLMLDVESNPEYIDEKSLKTDSTTYSINTPADDRFPFIPFPHQINDSSTFLYFSSDRNKKEIKYCNCESGDDRTENIGGYDIYKYKLPPKYTCPKEIEKPKLIYEPELYAEIVIKNLSDSDNEILQPIIKLTDENGNIIKETSDSSKISVKIDFGKNYIASGGSTYNSMDCSSQEDIIFRGYSSPSFMIVEKELDSLIFIDTLYGFKVKASDYLKMNNLSETHTSGFIMIKGIKTASDTFTLTQNIDARIEMDSVSYLKKITKKIIWRNFDLIPFAEPSFAENAKKNVFEGNVKSVQTLNNNFSMVHQLSNNKYIIHDTIYLLPDYILKPPCFCEFAGVLTTYQQNVPYFQTGFWEVNTLRNYRRDIPKLKTSRFMDASWIELHKNNKHFGEERDGRLSRHYQYENYARIVDSNLFKMADLIARNILPAFKIIDSITPGSKLIISLDAWSDRRPVTRGWYIGDDINYVEGFLEENNSNFEIHLNKVEILNKSSLNLNNDTLSRLRAYFGYKELLKVLLDTSKMGREFYDYYHKGLVLHPEDAELNKINLNKTFSIKAIEELIYKSKIIFLTKGNYFDSTQFKVPKYLKGVDSSLFMLDTIRRIDLRINTLYYEAGKLLVSPCCNPNLPCVDYNLKTNLPKSIIYTDPKKKTKKK